MATDQNGQKRNPATNLVPFKAAAEWNGNAGGRPKGRSLRALVREALTKNTVWGIEIPFGMTAKEAVAETVVKKAIEGSAPHLLALREILGEEARAVFEDAMCGATFQIVDNHRDVPAAKLDATDEQVEGDHAEQPGEIGAKQSE